MSPVKISNKQNTLGPNDAAITLSNRQHQPRNADQLLLSDPNESVQASPNKLEVFGSLSPSPELRHYTNPHKAKNLMPSTKRNAEIKENEDQQK